MLIEFKVKNFRSFKDEITLSLEKSTGEENENNIFKINNLELLKSVAIYGANASGKSNLISAFTCAILMIRNSNIISLGGQWNDIIPFLFDETTKNEPTSFEFVFIANKIKYHYAFKADNTKIYEEILEAYYSQKPTIIFKRTNVNQYTYKNDVKILKTIESKNTDNKLFLATAATWNYEKTKEPFLWFTNGIDTFVNFDKILDSDLKKFRNSKENIKEFTLNLLKEADIKIKDFNVDYNEQELAILTNLLTLTETNLLPTKSLNIEMIHEITDEDNKTKNYSLNFEDESSGTKILFLMAPILQNTFTTTKVLIIDEIEKSLHPALVEFLINLFHNPNFNKVNSQLIFTTHATNLLDLDIFRRDQIWFMEKNNAKGITDLYPLDDFSVRKNENIQKGYLNGKYGAIPFIKDNIL